MPDETVNKYDRTYSEVLDIGLAAKASTIKIVQSLTGKTATYIIQTVRTAHGDYLFIEIGDEAGLTRVYLPPKVTSVAASQRAALTKRNRSRASKASTRARMDAGEWTGFTKKAIHQVPPAAEGQRA